MCIPAKNDRSSWQEYTDKGRLINYRVLYDRVAPEKEITPGTVVENKRLSHVMEFIQFTQKKHELGRSQSVPIKNNGELDGKKHVKLRGSRAPSRLKQEDVRLALEEFNSQ